MSRIFTKNIFVHVLAVAHACLVSPSLAAVNATSIANICETAAHVASLESDVPLDVLRSISLTETGRKRKDTFQPWPWTVNMEGVGKWFDNLDAARHYVGKHHSRGARSFDVGCFQINYRWHGHHFESVDAMFDPLTNARYAARFLSELYAEFGDWSIAAGAYHSRSPKYANKYRTRFDHIRGNLSKSPIPDLTFAPATSVQPHGSLPRQNTFPLIQPSGRPTGIASLVRIGTSGTRFIDLQGAGSLTGH